MAATWAETATEVLTYFTKLLSSRFIQFLLMNVIITLAVIPLMDKKMLEYPLLPILYLGLPLAGFLAYSLYSFSQGQGDAKQYLITTGAVLGGAAILVGLYYAMIKSTSPTANYFFP